MTTKLHKIIILSLLLTSIFALVAVSVTFGYSELEETFLFETDLALNSGETETYNGSLFDVRQHIYKIDISGIKAKSNPTHTTNVVIFVNGIQVGAVVGPANAFFYNEAYAGKIEELVFTDAGLGVIGHVEISALEDLNPVYISLATATCVLSIYYFYINVNQRNNNKTLEEESVKQEITE